MATFLAAVELDPRARVFVIRSPDFPDLEERCDDISRAFAVAERAVRARVREQVARRGAVAPPTPRSGIEGRDEYRQCLLVSVDVEDRAVASGG